MGRKIKYLWFVLAAALVIAPASASYIQSVFINDGDGNKLTSQVNGSKRAIDVGIDVSGVQVDPRDIRFLSSSNDSVNIGNFPSNQTITGSVSVSNFPSSQAVTGSISVTNFPSSQPVTGPLTDAQLRASPVAVDVMFPSSMSVTQGTTPWLTDGSAHTQPISASSLPLPTGAATSANQSTTNTSLSSIDGKLAGVALDSSVNSLLKPSSTLAAVTSVGSIASTVTISASSLPLPTGAATSANQSTANTSLSSIDSKLTSPLTVTGPLTDTQLRASAVPISAASLPLPTGAATESTLSTINGKIPSGLTVTSTRLLVDGSGVTQPVSGSVTANAGSGTFTISGGVTQSGTWNVGLSTGANTVGKVDQGAGGASAWKVDGSAVTQPVSGTITANAGSGTFAISAASLPLPSGASTSANQTTANTSLSSIDSKLTSPLAVSQSGTWNINNISGTVSLPTLAATSTKQSDGSQKSQIVDGANATVGPVTTLSSVNYLPVVTAASATPGSAVVARSIQVAGSDGTNARTLSTDTSGNLNVNTASSSGRTSVQLVRNDYTSTNVTTSAYTQLIASTSDTVNYLYIFDSSGQTLFLAVGAAASEVNKAYIVPGGNGILNLTIPSGSRISIKAVSANATVGELSITLLK